MATIAITGASGFIGTRLSKTLATGGHVVKGITRDENKKEHLLSLGIEPVVLPFYNVRALMGFFNGVDHLVAISEGTRAELSDVNVGITKMTLAAANAAGVARFIYLSGIGANTLGKEEDADPYFRSKYLAEQAVQATSLTTVILRPSYLIDEGDELVSLAINMLVDGQVHVPGSLDTFIEPVVAQDAIEAIAKLCTVPLDKDFAIELVGPETLTVRAFFEKVLDELNRAGLMLSAPLWIPGSKTTDPVCHFIEPQVYGDKEKITRLLDRKLTPIETAIQANIRATFNLGEEIPEKRAIVLFSGGLDSTTLLYWALNEGHDVIGLSIGYSMRPGRELVSVRNIAAVTSIQLVSVELPFVKEVYELKREGYPVPSIFGAKEDYVPYRNLLFNAIAAYYADIYGASFVLSGHLDTEIDPLPDATAKFSSTLQELVASIKVGEKARTPEFLLPLKDLNKAGVIRLAVKLGVPIEWTWSCSYEFQTPCGQCPNCKVRLAAFEELGMKDPAMVFIPPNE